MQLNPAAAPSPSPGADAYRTTPAHVLPVAYRGTGAGLFVLAAKNLLLTLVTLGVYMPWARTERRKYLWQNIEVGGHRLRYHGTGRELLVGYLKVLAGYAVFIGVPLAARLIDPKLALVCQIVLALGVFLIIPVAIYGAFRYRLGRTSLRNIRFGLDAGLRQFWSSYVLGYLLVIVTFGLYAPVFQNRVHAYLTARTRYGSEAFAYDGSDGDAMLIGIKGFFLSLLTLGVYYPWYLAEIARFRTEHTILQGARGRLQLTGADMFGIMVVAFFGTVLTLGLGFPWITTYVLRTYLSKLSFVGEIDFTRVAQRAAAGDAAADDLAGALDVGLQI
ncbi:MAG TPA: DUF898 family protein [Polyangiaceae bacterium]|nr:DUF898 family protein [Polyangiaceae bacterium]